MTDIAALLERVKAATGPDAALGYDICKALGYSSPPVDYREYRSAVTATTDAALALANRLLNDTPDSSEYPLEVTLSSVGVEGPWHAAIWSGTEYDGQKHYAKTLPLAILAALLTSLQSQEPGDRT